MDGEKKDTFRERERGSRKCTIGTTWALYTRTVVYVAKRKGPLSVLIQLPALAKAHPSLL